MVNKILILLVILLSNLAEAEETTAEIKNKSQPSKTDEGTTIVPILFYTPETYFAGGAFIMNSFRFEQQESEKRPSSIIGNLVYTQKKQIIGLIQPTLYFNNAKWMISTGLSYVKFPTLFYGIGNKTSDRNEEKFTPTSIKNRIDISKQIYDSLYLGLIIHRESCTISEIKKGGLIDSSSFTGKNGSEIVGAGVSISWDNRNYVMSATKGILGYFSSITNSRSLGSQFNYSSNSLDLRVFFPLYLFSSETSNTDVLASQLKINYDIGDIPFNLLPQTGGSNIMRGLQGGRYRDSTSFVLQEEYRFPLPNNFSSVIFMGLGNVFASPKDISVQNFIITGGIGARWFVSIERRIPLRLDLGFTDKTWTPGVYFSISEAY